MPQVAKFCNFIDRSKENLKTILNLLNKNDDDTQIQRIVLEMGLEDSLSHTISSEMMNMLRKICEAKLLAQDDLTVEQAEKYQNYENAINAKRNIGCVHIKGFAGTGKTFLGLHFICEMLIENPNANILFACTKNAFAYFFVRWI